MRLKMDVAGIDVYLKINNYRTLTEEDEWDCRWCKCDFSFSSGCWLNYHKNGDEVLLSSEVEEMTDRLTRLLNDEIAEPERISFVEPDFVFKLHPKRDMRKDGDHIWIRPGCEIADIYVEWEIYFWHEGLTDNHLTITLGREEIIQLREYLIAIIN